MLESGESGVALLCLLRARVPSEAASQFYHIPFHTREIGLLSVLEHFGAGLVASWDSRVCKEGEARERSQRVRSVTLREAISDLGKGRPRGEDTRRS